MVGFAEMQGPYYQYLGSMNPHTPYLVMSMSKDYSPRLNFKFVECGLLGWPGVPAFKPGEWPMRVVLKNPSHGKACKGHVGHAWCNLATSWGLPKNNIWRATAREINGLIKLCTEKYQCDVVKASIHKHPTKQIPQVFLIKVRRDKS